MRKMRAALEIVATVSMISASVLICWKIISGGSYKPATRVDEPSRIPVPAMPVSIEGTEVLGKTSATATLIVFSDYECPYCAAFEAGALKKLRDEFVAGGRLRIAFWNYPLSSIHRSANGAAIAAECASEQGRFWDFHDLLFRAQESIGSGAIEEVGRAVGLDSRLLQACRAREDSARKLSESAAKAKALGVTSTPTVFLGSTEADGRVTVTKTLVGMSDYEYLKQAINSLGR